MKDDERTDKRHCCRNMHCARDGSCGLTHDSSHITKPQPSPVIYSFLGEDQDYLEIPEVHVPRGGLRFWPMLPVPGIRIMEQGRWFWKRYAVVAFPPSGPGTGTIGIPLGVFKNKWDAQLLQKRVIEYQRGVYAEIKRRVEEI